MKKRIGKNDLIFLGVVLILALLLWAGMEFGIHRDSNEAGTVVITVDGGLYGSYPLNVDAQIPIVIDGKTANLLLIADGRADMTEADCPDKLCVHQRAISRENETIVCLPNKVVVTIAGSKESEIDSIAK